MALLMAKRAAVLGGAECVWEDLIRLESIYGELWDGLVIATNEAGRDYQGRVDHWVSLHPDRFPEWEAGREGNEDYVRWSRPTHREMGPVDMTTSGWKGSSGLLAVKVGIELGCSHIVCCGVPMDPRPHYHEDNKWEGGKWEDWEVFRDAWKHRANALWEAGVRSMSGWTRDLLGEPTEEWLLQVCN